MENAGLLNLSFIASIAGILILMSLSEIMQPPLIEISSINKKMLESSIAVQGIVASENNFDNFRILEICDNNSSCIPVTLNIKEKLSNSLADKKVVVFGKLIEYKNKLQINANKIVESSS